MTPFKLTHTEPTKKCRKCGTMTPYSLLVPGVQCKDGVQALCKKCKGKQQMIDKKKREDKARELVKAQAEARKMEMNIVLPRTFNHLKDKNAIWTGHTERQYIRNEGLKHIPSRGMPT